MPGFDDLEREAESHSKEADEAIDKASQAADQEAGGRDKGLIDKGATAAKDRLDNSPQGDMAAPQGEAPPEP